MQRITCSLLAVISLSTAMSCTQNNSTPGQCKLVHVTTRSSGHSEEGICNITYDNGGKIKLITLSGGQTTTFRYGNSTVFAYTSQGSQMVRADSFIIGTNGMVSDLYHTQPALSPPYQQVTTSMHYTYNADKTLSKAESGKGDVYSYQSKDGDIISFSGNGTTTVFSYYTDKDARDGDVMKWEQVWASGGALYFKSKHLLKGWTVKNMAPVVTHTYTNDGSGNIIKAVSNTGISYDFSYDCN